MKIEKILNNNVAVTLNDKGNEIVIMGRGIVFQKKIGEMIDETKIEKKFVLSEKEMNTKFQELLMDMPIEHIIISEKIINYAKMHLGKKLSDGIYLTLTDHISSAIKRYKEGIQLKNPLLWDIKQFYPDEFALGLKSINILNDEFGIDILEDEAAFITLHFVNAQLNENMAVVHSITKLIQEVTSIVKYHFKLIMTPSP